MTALYRNLLTALAVTAASLPALAATPNLNGTYNLRMTTFCQMVVVDGALTLHGDYKQDIGTITFTPAMVGGQAGSISGTTKSIEGAAAAMTSAMGYTYEPSDRMSLTAHPFTGTYSMTATTMTIKITGEPNRLLQAYYGQVNATSGLAKHADILRLERGTASGLEPKRADCQLNGTVDRVN